MKKKYQVCGLGNAIVDLLTEVSSAKFKELALESGTMRLVTTEEQAALLNSLGSQQVSVTSGGSVANSIIAFAQLGGRAAFIGCVGDDRYGLHFQEEFASLGVEFGHAPIRGATTATSLVLITPDAERTMRTCLAVSSDLSDSHVNEEIIGQSEWLFIEGYVFSNSDTGQKAIARSLQLAKQYHTKVAITCSEAWVVQNFGGPLRTAIAQADLIFANESEACALAEAASLDQALVKLKNIVPNFVVTAGEKGAIYKYEQEEGQAAAVKCVPVDLTGAGDMLAGSFLYGINHGITAHKSATAACAMATEVITRIGARIPNGSKDIWNVALSN